MAKKEEKTEVKADVVPSAPAKPAYVPKVLKNITLPLIKLTEDIPEYVKITGEMFVGKELKGTGEKATMEPATLCHVTNLQTGEEAQLIVNAVVKGNLEEHYPGAAYVGKGFAITKHAKRTGKRYNDFSLQEIEV
jgi:hypothetical protein